MSRPLLLSPATKARLEELLPQLRKAFDEAKHPRHPKGSSKGGQFMQSRGGGDEVGGDLREPTSETSPDKRAVDRGLAAGNRLREIRDRYHLDTDEVFAAWRGGIDVSFRKFGPKWRPDVGNVEQVHGDKLHREIVDAVGAFGDQPWPNNAWAQAFYAGLGGLKRLRYVRGWRYGAVPDRGYSHNYREDAPEPGVSLMQVTSAADDDPLPPEPADYVSKMFIESAGKPKVWVEGWLLPKRGSDGEPLVVGARKVTGDAK